MVIRGTRVGRRGLCIAARVGTALTGREVAAVACLVRGEGLGVATMLLRLEQMVIRIGDAVERDQRNRGEFDDPDFQQISHLFVTENEGPIHNDEKEWQWSSWMSKAEVDDLLRENKLCTDTAAMYVRYVSEFENLPERF